MNPTSPSESPLVFVVDDDPGMRAALQRLFRSVHFEVETYASGRELLDRCNLLRPGVLLLDVLMPGMTGLELQAVLLERGVTTPIVFLTGTHSVPMAVTAMQRGAVDFLEKPFANDVLVERIRFAHGRNRQLVQRLATHRFDERFALLTPREREVMFHVADGKTSKETARALRISPRTVEVHRIRVMDKMRADSLAQLVRMSMALGIRSGEPAPGLSF